MHTLMHEGLFVSLKTSAVMLSNTIINPHALPHNLEMIQETTSITSCYFKVPHSECTITLFFIYIQKNKY